MSRFQFSLRDLFLATTLIAIGIFGLVWAFPRIIDGHDGWPEIAVGLPSAGFIGAGIGAILHEKAFFALLAAFALCVIMFFIPHEARVPNPNYRPAPSNRQAVPGPPRIEPENSRD